jgi:hypothetical protein
VVDRDILIDAPVVVDLGKIANTMRQAIHDSRSATDARVTESF